MEGGGGYSFIDGSGCSRCVDVRGCRRADARCGGWFDVDVCSCANDVREGCRCIDVTVVGTPTSSVVKPTSTLSVSVAVVAPTAIPDRLYSLALTAACFVLSR